MTKLMHFIWRCYCKFYVPIFRTNQVNVAINHKLLIMINHKSDSLAKVAWTPINVDHYFIIKRIIVYILERPLIQVSRIDIRQ